MLLNDAKELVAMWRKDAVTARKMMLTYSASSRAFHVYQEKAATLENCAFILEAAIKSEDAKQ